MVARNIHIQFIIRIFLFYNFKITAYISDPFKRKTY